MPTATLDTPDSAASKPSLVVRIASLRFFTFSFLAHVVVLIFAGGIVMVRNMEPPADFAPGEGLVVPDGQDATPPPVVTPPDVTEFKPPTPAASSSTIDAITSLSTANTSFQIQPAVASIKMDGMSEATAASVGKGIGDKLGALGGTGGRMGGSGFFGMKDMGKKNLGLTGTFYDAKQTRAKRPTNIDVNQFSELISKFVSSGWKENILRDCYQAPKQLVTTQIFMPNMPAEEGPKAFDVGDDVKPSRWLVHYQGRISPPATGEYRFVGAGDDYLVVRFNQKVVLDQGFAKATDWKPEQFYNYGWTAVPNGFARGDKFHATAGQFYDLDVLISERPGGLVFFCLMIEDQSIKHRQDDKGNPILPVFRLAEQPMPPLEKNQTLPPYDPVGPIWKVVTK